jgi:hypothetical protein
LGSPDFANSGAPVVKLSGAWVYRDQRDTRDPPGPLVGLGGAWGRGCYGRGRSVRRCSPACGVPAAVRAKVYDIERQKDQGTC